MQVSSTFLDKYNVSGPRYTSYPPANFFQNSFNEENYINAVRDSNKQQPEAISLYIHIPFCPMRCHFCGCNSVAGQSEQVVARYVAAIKKEIQTVGAELDKRRPLTQIHWGGGTPNSIAMHYIEEIMALIRDKFIFDKNAEIAIECSPAYLEYEHIDSLAAIGFNRMSLGIQDFRLDVLKAINRMPPKYPVKDIVDYLRSKGFKGINLDFIYGLPLQTVEGFSETIKKAIECDADRIVTFSYAHVPWFNAEQKRFEEMRIPSPEEKMDMLVNTISLMQNAGYTPIGIDHFVKQSDELYSAYVTKKLHRNFQGYCTRTTTGQVYGFGASSISQLWGAYAQNKKGITSYMEAIENTGLATERGYSLNADQIVVRSVINSIMCNGVLDFRELSEQFNIDKQKILAIVDYNESRLEQFLNDGLITINDDRINISDTGRMVARNIAMAFDPDLKQGEFVYSKTV